MCICIEKAEFDIDILHNGMIITMNKHFKLNGTVLMNEINLIRTQDFQGSVDLVKTFDYGKILNYSAQYS